jgi:hypothetical protein
MMPASYPARQRNRRLARGGQHGVVALVMFLLTGAAASSRISGLALPLLAVGLIFAIRCWHSLGLARRSSIGARSEQRVRAELTALDREGWSICHSLRWRGGGDVDHLAFAPPGVGLGFAIETKTRTYRPGDLVRITAIAQWTSSRHPRWCRGGTIPVVCLAGARGVERWKSGVLIVSADRLVALLRRLAGTTSKPRFLR